MTTPATVVSPSLGEQKVLSPFEIAQRVVSGLDAGVKTFRKVYVGKKRGFDLKKKSPRFVTIRGTAMKTTGTHSRSFVNSKEQMEADVQETLLVAGEVYNQKQCSEEEQ